MKQGSPAAGDRCGGQALVEFAAVLPVLLLVTIGLINLGLLMAAQLELTQAAWEGARAGATILNPAVGDAEIRGAIDGSLYLLDPSRLAVSIEPNQDEWPRTEPWPEPRGHPIRVTLSYDYPLYLPGTLQVQLQARAVSRIEYQNP
ncbi:MAG TPA: TadE/TadG family type IV pilus assembly protein [Anaerolineales bacterium]